MRKRSIFASASWLALLALLAPPAQSADGAPAAGGAGSPAQSVPSERLRRQLEERRDRVLERLRKRGVASAEPSPAPSSAKPSSSVAASPSSVFDTSTQRELQDKWRKWLETRLERRERHRNDLVRNVGTRLADLQVRDELRLHATRVAELSRIQFLAENARTGAQREKLLARVEKLLAREQKRHDARLSVLLAAAPSPSAAPSAAAPTAAPFPSGAKP